MKALWIDAGNDPDWQKLAGHGIRIVYLPVTDPVADVKRRMAEIRQRKLVVGLYSAWNWLPGNDGAAFAEWTHDHVSNLVPNATPSYPKVQLDNEVHDPAQILAMLRRWRALRPKQDTSWTFEGMQGGWMSPAFVSEVTSLRVRLVPQLYNGAMTQAWDSLTNARDLTKRGFPDALISPFYDAARLPVGWDGFCFTQGRLP